MRADFQEFYGLDTDEIGSGIRLERAASLAVQLPKGCRVFSAMDPELSWTDKEWLLARCEHLLSLLLWIKTEDGQKNRNMPKMLTPAPASKPHEYTREEMEEVAAAFGIDI